MQKSICEANFAWIFACYWNGVNSNVAWFFGGGYKHIDIK